jgi:hypothetical protein
MSSIKVKDPATIAAKWKTRASAAAPDYGTGVAGAAGSFESAAVAANDTYKQAVTAAAAKDRYAKGVTGSGAKWQKNATTLGVQRYPTGVANAQDAMAAGIAPVVQTLNSLTLPPRGVKGNNAQRSQIVADALHKMKYGA